MPLATEDFEYFRKRIRGDAIRWFLDIQYWLGFLTGRNSADFRQLDCEKLSFEWWVTGAWWCISIFPEGRQGLSSIGGRDPFAFKVHMQSASEEDLLIVGDIEKSILEYYPGITQVNTVAVCNLGQSKNCPGKQGDTSICYTLGIKTVCEECKAIVDGFMVPETSGFVYVAGNEEAGYFKIGASRHPHARVRLIGPKLPFPISIFHQIEADDKIQAESRLHRAYNNKRAEGEWFTLTKEDIAFIRSLSVFREGKFCGQTGEPVDLLGL